jgi:hypothetical protein
VLFRSIKRGRSPKVAAVKWSRDTLLTRITQLYECVLSIDAAVNVFGVDCGEFFLEEDVKSQLIQLALLRISVRNYGLALRKWWNV